MDDRRSFFGRAWAAVLGLLGYSVAAKAKPGSYECWLPHIEWHISPAYFTLEGKAAYWTSLEINGSQMRSDEGRHLLETCLNHFKGSPAPREGFQLTSREWRYFPDDRVLKGVWRYEEI